MATPIIIPLTADLKGVKAGLKETESRLKKFSKSAGGILKGAAKGFAAIGVAAGAAATKGIQEFVQLDKKVREVLTLGGGDVTTKAVAGLTDRIEAIATEYGQAAEDVAGSFYDSISAGIDASAVDSFVEDAAKLATAGGTTIGAAVDILTSATNAFGMSAEDAGKISDTLFGTVKAGKTTIDEISAAFSQVGPVAAATGVSLEDVSSWLGALTLSGTPTKQAATQIKAALAELSKPASKISKQFKELSGKTFPDFVSEGGSLADALGIIEEAGEEADGGLVAMFGSIEAYQGVLGVTGQSSELFAGTLDTVSNSAGATAEAFEVMAGGADYAFTSLREEVGAVLRDIGAAVLPAVQQLIPAITPLLKLLGDALADIAITLAPVIEQLIAGLAPALAELIPPLLEIVTALLPPLADLLLALLPALIPIANILADVLVIAAKALGVAIRFVATGIELLMNWLGPLLTRLSELTGNLVDRVTPAMDGLIESTGWAIAIWERFWDVLKAIGYWFRDVFTAVWRAVGDDLTAGTKAYIAAIVAIFNGLVTFVQTVIIPAWKIAFKVISKVVHVFIEAMKVYFTVLKTVANALMVFFQTVILPAWRLIYQGLSAVVKDFSEFLKAIFNVIRVVTRGVITFFKVVVIPAWKGIYKVFEQVAKVWLEVFKAIWKAILTSINGVIKFFEGTIIPAWRAIWAAFQAPINIARGAINALISAAQSAIDLIGRVKNAASNIPGAGAISGITGGIGNVVGGIGNVLGFAKGGLVKQPVLGVLGEAGPELVLPLDRLPELGGGKTVYNDNRKIELHATPFATSAELGEMLESTLQVWQAHKGGLDLEIAGI